MAEDVLRRSEALDQLAQIILAQSNKKKSVVPSIKEEYETKLKNLDELVSLITSVELDKNKFTELVSRKIEVIEKDGQEYALIPVCRPRKPASKPKNKRNAIKCSYCNEPGHLRSKCDKKLLGLPP